MAACPLALRCIEVGVEAARRNGDSVMVMMRVVGAVVPEDTIADWRIVSLTSYVRATQRWRRCLDCHVQCMLFHPFAMPIARGSAFWLFGSVLFTHSSSIYSMSTMVIIPDEQHILDTGF